MIGTRASRGEEPLLSGLAEDGDVVSLDYEDHDKEYAESDTPPTETMPSELCGETVENSSDKLDTPRSGKSPAAADEPKTAKKPATIRIKTYKTAVAAQNDDAEKTRPDQTKALMKEIDMLQEKLRSKRIENHDLREEVDLLRGRIDCLSG